MLGRGKEGMEREGRKARRGRKGTEKEVKWKRAGRGTEEWDKGK